MLAHCLVSLALSSPFAPPLQEDVAPEPAVDAVFAEARELVARATRSVPPDHAELARALDLLVPLPPGDGENGALALVEEIGEAAVRAGNLRVGKRAWVYAVEGRRITDGEEDSDYLYAQSMLGIVHLNSGELVEAQRAQEIALLGYERMLPADHPNVALARANLAATLMTMGRVDLALPHIEKSVAALERSEPADSTDLAQARANLASIRIQLGDAAGARPLLEAALATFEKSLPEEDPRYLEVVRGLAWARLRQGDPWGARDLQERALAVYERTLPPGDDRLLTARTELAESLARLGELPRSVALLESVLEERERQLGPDHELVAMGYLNVGGALHSAGELERARAALERGVEAFREHRPPDHPEFLGALGTLAYTMQAMGDNAEALAIQRRVLEAQASQFPPESEPVLRAKSGVATTLLAMGELEGARDLFAEVLRVEERTLSEDDPSLNATRQNYAAVLHLLGDQQASRALGEKALASFERTLPEAHPNLAIARGHVAAAMLEMGDLEGAKSLLTQSLTVMERNLPPENPDLLRMRGNLAAVLQLLDEPAEAIRLLESVLVGFEASLPPDHPDVIGSRVNLGTLLAELGEREAAREILEDAAATMERSLGAQHPNLIRVRQGLATLEFESGEPAESRRRYERILADLSALLPSDHPDVMSVRSGIAATYLVEGDREAARRVHLEVANDMLRRVRSLGLVSRREARAGVASELDRHAKLRLATNAEDTPLRFELAETLRHVALVPPVAERKAGPELAETRRRLSDLIAGAGSESHSSAELLGRVAELGLARDRLERELRESLGGDPVLEGGLTPQRVAASLPPGAAALGFLRLPSWTVDVEAGTIRSAGDVISAHVVLGDGSVREHPLGPAADLQRLALDWREAVGQPLGARGVTTASAARELREDHIAALAAELRQRLLDPVLDELGSVTSLHVCRDDFLFTLPLDALADADGRILGDELTIVEEVSFGRLLAGTEDRAGELTLLSVGGVDYGARPAGAGASGAVAAPIRGAERAGLSFAALDETEAEARAAAGIFAEARGGTARVVTGEDATKARLIELAPESRYLHVATHGWFAPETVPSVMEASAPRGHSLRVDARESVRGFAPLALCGLALAGANRGADALGRVPGILTAEELSGLDLSACELAVLSACETNVGIRRAGQGVQSLQAALHAAGARTAITSLWKVDDAMTRQLMERFYAYLWVEELPKAEALWRAKCDLRAEGAAVRDWAGWVLSGDPN